MSKQNEASKTIRATVRKYLVSAIAAQAGVTEAEETLQRVRAGMYTCTVLAAISADGDKAVFIEVCEALMQDFRANKRGIAKKYGVEQAKDKQGNLKTDSEGNPVYKVPGSLSTAKSVLGKSFDWGTGLGTIEAPNAFTAIRDAGTVARDEKAKAAAPKVSKAMVTAQGHLARIAEALEYLDAKSLKALNVLLESTAKQLLDGIAPTSAAKAA